jgi:hypothetical protein
MVAARGAVTRGLAACIDSRKGPFGVFSRLTSGRCNLGKAFAARAINIWSTEQQRRRLKKMSSLTKESS